MEGPYHVEQLPSQEPTYRSWNTSNGFVPVLIRVGPRPWENAVKLGEEWLSGIKSVRVNFDNQTYPSVTLELFGDVTVERVDR